MIKSADLKKPIFVSISMKVSAIAVIISCALTYSYSQDFKGVFGSVLVFGALATFGWFVFPYALILTSYRSSQIFGAAIAVFISLALLKQTIQELLKGNGFAWMFKNPWYGQLIIFIFIAAICSTYYIVITSSKSHKKMKTITLVLVAIMVPVQYLKSLSGDKVVDTVTSWQWHSIVSIALVVAIGLVVLYFSDIQSTIFSVMLIALIFALFRFMETVHYLQDVNQQNPLAGFGVSLPETGSNAFVIVQFVVALIVFLYALYTTHFEGKKYIAESH